jgi:deoxyribodipyrimidine photo-lyase
VDLADDLPADATSHLSPYLHFGCLSANELLSRVDEQKGLEDFARRLCWRDFHHQVLAAGRHPLQRLSEAATSLEEPRGRLDAWKEGRTGYPIVDAGMRQLADQGFLPNRARLIVASFLTKTLGIDWRAGALHFERLLVDGDLANNVGNWQWVAGTGNDTRPNRVLNPIRQARRFDPEGEPTCAGWSRARRYRGEGDPRALEAQPRGPRGARLSGPLVPPPS